MVWVLVDNKKQVVGVKVLVFFLEVVPEVGVEAKKEEDSALVPSASLVHTQDIWDPCISGNGSKSTDLRNSVELCSANSCTTSCVPITFSYRHNAP